MADGSISLPSALFPSQSTSAGGDHYGYDSHSTTGESHSSHSYGDDAGAHGDHAGDHAHHITDFGIGTLVLAMCLGAASRTYLTHVTGLPYTVILLLLGLLFGLVLHEEWFGDMGVVGESLARWAGVDSQVILFVFLPILIFESAFETDVHIFQREFWQVVALAGPGVAMATIMTGSIVKFIFPYGWDWNLSLMLGGVLSATDPVAVVALLKELGVSERLNVLIEGESLLNDATGIVVFIVFRDAFVGAAESSPAQVLITAVRMSFGGPVVGLVMGMFGSFLLGYIIDDAMTEITLTLIVCFSSFMISESTKLHVSGVLAAVTAGLVMSFYAGGRISPGVEHSMHTFWSMATYVANTVIFFVSGVIIGDRAIFARAIGGREWGLLCLLYLLLQLVRSAVVVLLLPVLTKWGYGMSYKQLVVLAFAGLRGAVGLTLALIFVEDERIEDSIRSLVLFYVAGIAAMTLVINGSLAGYLVSYLHLDRSTTAETEVFTKACSAIEARLEHKLDLLKGDRFLGDADWEMVWRYIPVSTSNMYWHRIRHGNVNLSEQEEEDIHIIRDGMIHKAGLKGEVAFRAYQLNKWFTRKVLRTPGGIGYDVLPSRLRATWYTYHKNFHLSPFSGDANQHRRDMELQRLNAEPRMMLEAEAWSNLNAGESSVDPVLANQTPVSHTLRKHLDNVGMLGFQDDTGMLSDFGQREMAKQAAGAKSGSMFGSGRGGPEALRMVEGVKNLKEDRRRARQAVAQAEARLARLKKDMKLVQGKGEEEEMKDYMKQASKGLILTSASMHGPGSMAPSKSDRDLKRQGSLGSSRASGRFRRRFDLDDEKDEDGHARDSDHNSDDDDDHDHDDAVGMPMDDSNHDGGGGGGGGNGEGGEEGDGHEVRVKTDVAPEWNPYEDSDEEDGGSNPRLAMGQRRNPAPTASITASSVTATATGGKGDGGGAVTMGSMAEARVRFLTAVKAHYTARYHQGWLSSMGLRVLKGNMDFQLDQDQLEMDQWSHLSKDFQLPQRLAFLRKIPIVGNLVESYMYRRLTVIFELASNFISAHEDVDILELLHEGPVAYQLALEKNRQLEDARGTLSQQLPVFPELARSLKTRVAAKYMLVQHREVVHELFHHGHINERESEGLISENNTARVKLEYHPTADQIPDRFTLLKNVPFLRFLTDEEKAAIINNEKACQEEFYGSNVVLMNEKTSFARGTRRQGWFNVVRGAVRQNTEGMLGHTSSGGTMRMRKLAKERLVNAGTVVGLDEQLMQAPYQCTYTTASFVHLFFFDKTQMLILAEQYPGLKRGLWWLLAVSVVRHHDGFRRMNLAGVYQLMKTAEFKEFKGSQKFSLTDSRHAGKRDRVTLNSSRHGGRTGGMTSLNSSRHGGGGASHAASPAHGVDNRPAIVRAASSLNESRHKLTQGLRRSVSRGQLSNTSDYDQSQLCSPEAGHAMILEPGSNILLLKGGLRRRFGSAGFPSLREEMAVTIVRDVSGPVEFFDGTVVFIMPAVLMARASAAHQLLMREIEQRHRDMASESAAAAAGATAATDGSGPRLTSAALEAEAFSLEGTSPRARRNKSSSFTGSGKMGDSGACATSPSRERVRSFSGAGGIIVSKRNAVATDAVTMAAADEANPQLHPDALRRRRTLRDAGLAAKATANFPSSAANDATAATAAAATAGAGADSAVAADDSAAVAAEEGGAPWIGRRVMGVGGRTHVVARDHSTARLSLGSRQSFVEMQNVPVTSDVIGGPDIDSVSTPKGGRASRQQQQTPGRRTLDI
eukprot:g20525.t1